MPPTPTTIHQIYGTHCTYGTSAIDRREGEAARGVLGYSARAGSLGGSQLRDHYLAVKRFLYYYLPADAPADLVLKLTQETAPRRLFYCPSTPGLRVFGQICFREKDAHPVHPSPGSYFGHVLLADEKTASWDILDCLRLWNAPGWRTEDGPNIPPQLPWFDRFDDLRNAFLQRQPPPDFDAILEHFLLPPDSARGPAGPDRPSANAGAAPARPNIADSAPPPVRTGPPPPPPPPRRKAPAASTSYAPAVLPQDSSASQSRGPNSTPPAGLVPARWLDVPYTDRQKYFRAALAGYLEVAAGRRKSLLLLAEPEISILIVYAIARLLPRGIRQQISFSNYETAPDRLCTSIAAIAFHNDQTDLPADRYRRDYVVNTRTGKVSPSPGSASSYLDVVWDQALMSGGWRAVDRVLDACEAGQLGDVAALARCQEGERFADTAVNPKATPDDVGRLGPGMGGYARRRVAHRLSEMPPNDDTLQKLIHSAGHRQALVQLTRTEAACEPQVKEIIKTLNAKEVQEWYLSTQVNPLPAYVDAALEFCASIIKPGHVLQVVKDPNFLPERRERLLPHLVNKLQIEELVPFLAIPSVAPELKKSAVARLAPQVPSEQILPFLCDAGIPPESKRQALHDFITRIPKKHRLALLKLPPAHVDDALKKRLLREQACDFSGRAALELLTDRDVRDELKEFAVGQPGFLDRVDRGALAALLQLSLVPPEQKIAQLNRLAGELTEDDLLRILRDPQVGSLECKRHLLTAPALAQKFSPEQLLTILLDVHVGEACKLAILASESLASGLPETQIESLLQDPRLSAACQDAACRNAALLARIPENALGALATSEDLPERCREFVFAHATLPRKVPPAGFAEYLADPRLPRACKAALLLSDELLEQLSGDDVLSLLRSGDLPPDARRQALARSSVLRKIPTERILEVLADANLPAQGRMAALRDPALAERISAAQVEAILCHPGIPAEYKVAITTSKPLLDKALEADVVAMAGDVRLPPECRQVLAAKLNLDALPSRRIVDVLEIEVIPESRKRDCLDRRADQLVPADVCRLLASDRVPEALKQQAVRILRLLECIDSQGAVELLANPHVPETCHDALATRLPHELTFDEVERMLARGRLPDHLRNLLVELIGEIPEAEFPDMLERTCLKEEFKGERLFRFLVAKGRLPRGCDALALEELGLAAWQAGPLRELFRRVNARVAKKLCDHLLDQRLPHRNARYVSLYVSLFKSVALSGKRDKLNLLLALGESLAQTPRGDAGLHQILEILLPFVRRNPLSPGLPESLAPVTKRIVDDLSAIVETDPDTTLRRIEFLEQADVSPLLNATAKQGLAVWRTILKDLAELGRAWNAARTGGGGIADSVDQIRQELLEQLGVPFPDVPPEYHLPKIRGLAERCGFDVGQLSLHSAPLPPPAFRQSRRPTHKRESGLVVKLLIAVGVALLVIIIGMLVKWGVEPDKGTAEMARATAAPRVEDVKPAKNQEREADKPAPEPATPPAVPKPAAPAGDAAEAQRAAAKPAAAKPGSRPATEAKPVTQAKPATEAKRAPITEPPAAEEKMEPPKVTFPVGAQGHKYLIAVTPKGPLFESDEGSVDLAEGSNITIREYSLHALHGLDLVNKRLTGGRTVRFEKTDGKQQGFEEIIVQILSGPKPPVRRLVLRLEDNRVSYQVNNLRYDDRRLLRDCVLEVRKRGQQESERQYISLAPPARERFAFEKGVATIPTEKLRATLPISEVLIDKVNVLVPVWKTKKKDWIHPLQSETPTAQGCVWHSSSPKLLDCSDFKVAIECSEGTLKFRLLQEPDLELALRNYNRLCLAEYCFQEAEFTGTKDRIPDETLSAFLRDLGPDTPGYALQDIMKPEHAGNLSESGDAKNVLNCQRHTNYEQPFPEIKNYRIMPSDFKTIRKNPQQMPMLMGMVEDYVTKFKDHLAVMPESGKKKVLADLQGRFQLGVEVDRIVPGSGGQMIRVPLIRLPPDPQASPSDKPGVAPSKVNTEQNVPSPDAGTDPRKK